MQVKFMKNNTIEEQWEHKRPAYVRLLSGRPTIDCKKKEGEVEGVGGVG